MFVSFAHPECIRNPFKSKPKMSPFCKNKPEFPPMFSGEQPAGFSVSKTQTEGLGAWPAKRAETFPSRNALSKRSFFKSIASQDRG